MAQITITSVSKELEQAANEDALLRPLVEIWESSVPDPSENLLESFIANVEDKKMSHLFPLLGKCLILQQIRSTQGDKNTMLREESVAVAFLSALWHRGEGITYLKTFIPQLVDRIGRSDLELDPKKGMLELIFRMDKLHRSLHKTIDHITHSDQIFPQQFKEMLRITDHEISKRFEVGLSLVGGLVFLRLVNPSIIFPEKHHLVPEGSITSEGRSGLVWIARILQNMANHRLFEESKDRWLKPINSFIRCHQSKWDAFFQKLVTGETFDKSVSPLDALETNADDLLFRSNLKNDFQLENSIYGKEQHQMVHHAFALEKQMKTWKIKKFSDCTVHYMSAKAFGGTNIIYGMEMEIPCTVTALHAWLSKFDSETQKRMFVEARQQRTVEELSDSCRIMYSEHKMANPMSPRDFVYMAYSEILPEEGFFIHCVKSVERADIPPIKGIVRGEIVGAQIFRSIPRDPTRTLLTTIEHVDLAGFSNATPSGMLKQIVLNHCRERIRSRMQLFAEPDVLQEIRGFDKET